MKLFNKAKDGGPESPVDAFFIVEWKNVFSVAVLKFNEGGREAFHTHAFNALTWFLKGELYEEEVDGTIYQYRWSLLPKVTPRRKNHRVLAQKDSWCLTVRGPWYSRWTEYNKETDTTTTLRWGRGVVGERKGV